LAGPKGDVGENKDRTSYTSITRQKERVVNSVNPPGRTE